MASNFWQGLGNIGEIVQGVDRSSYNDALRRLALQQVQERQQQMQAQAGLLPTLRALSAAPQQTAPPGPTPLPVQQQPLPPLPQNMANLPQVPQTGGAMGGQLPPPDRSQATGGFGVGGAGMPDRMTPDQVAAGQGPWAQPASGSGLSVPQLGIQERAGIDPSRIQLAAANQTYQQVKALISPDDQKPAMDGTRAVLSAMGNPLQFAGRMNFGDLIKAIDTANPKADDTVKSAIFTNLYPMLNNQGKLGFSEAIDLFKVALQKDEFTARQKQQREEFDIRQQELGTQRDIQNELLRQRIGQGEQRVAQGQQRIDEGIGRGAGGTQGLLLRRYLEEHPDAKAEDIQKFMSVGRSMPRSGQAAAVQRYLQENPDATDEDIKDYVAGLGAQVTGTRYWTTGQGSNTVRNINVAMNHTDTLMKLGDALQNQDSRALNTLKNALATQFGYSGPVDFNSAKQIVVNEIVKGTSGSVLTGEERTSLAEQISASSTPGQIADVLNKALRPLLAGQLDGLHRQFRATPGMKEEQWERMLSPETQERLGGVSTMGQPSTAPSGDDFSKMSDDEILKKLGIRP